MIIILKKKATPGRKKIASMRQFLTGVMPGKGGSIAETAAEAVK